MAGANNDRLHRVFLASLVIAVAYVICHFTETCWFVVRGLLGRQ